MAGGENVQPLLIPRSNTRQGCAYTVQTAARTQSDGSLPGNDAQRSEKARGQAFCHRAPLPFPLIRRTMTTTAKKATSARIAATSPLLNAVSILLQRL